MSVWDETKIEILKSNWGRLSAAALAEKIGDGVSRNAVIGKAHRLNLSAKIKSRSRSVYEDSSKIDKLKYSSQRKGVKKRFKSFLISKDFEPMRNLTLEQLTEDTCKYMESHVHPSDLDPRFCGRKTVVGKNKRFSYCPLHLMLIFNDPKNKREDIIDKDDEVPQFIEKKIKSA